ncbi:hypothetical protein V1477_020335, partial [Vespula maculifrons]
DDIRRNNTGHLTDDNDVPEGQGRVILAHSKTTHSHLGQDPNEGGTLPDLPSSDRCIPRRHRR